MGLVSSEDDQVNPYGAVLVLVLIFCAVSRFRPRIPVFIKTGDISIRSLPSFTSSTQDRHCPSIYVDKNGLGGLGSDVNVRIGT